MAQPAWARPQLRGASRGTARASTIGCWTGCEDFADLVQYDAGKARSQRGRGGAARGAQRALLRRDGRAPPGSRRGRGLLPVLTRIDRHYQPKGLVGVIAPWNYPLTMAISDGLAALMAGNAVLLKPDRQTPFSALAAVDLLSECGLPDDLWQVVNGEGATRRPGVDLDGGLRLLHGIDAGPGRPWPAQCAEQLIGCSLELGGKNPLLVLGDADVDRAAEGAVRACFSNAGQLCLSAERLFVAESVLDDFTAAFVARTRSLRLGTSTDYRDQMGGLMNAAQLERVEQHVEDARGARSCRADRWSAAARSRAAVLRADHPDRRDGRDALPRRGDVRTGGQHLSPYATTTRPSSAPTTPSTA